MTKKEDKKICFVISPIGDENSETRKRSDKVLEHIITPPIEQLGYKIVRADKISKPGIITTQIIQHIVDASLVIADLTERNPNVFYELALRHAIRKPLVQIIQKGEIIPFDVAATRIIQFELELDNVKLAKTEILTQVRSLETENNEIDNPISVSLDLKILKESGNDEQRSLAELFEEFKGMVENLPSRIEGRLENDSRRRKRRRFHPGMFEEMMYVTKISDDPNLGFLMMLSFLKEDMPWIYEIGMETYRGLKKAKTMLQKQKLVSNFEKVLEMMRHPIMMEFSDRSEDMFMFNNELRHFLNQYLRKHIIEGKK